MFTYSGAVGRRLAGADGFGRDAGEEVGRNHGLAQIVHPAPIEEVAALEAGEDSDMLRVEGEIALGRVTAEPGAGAGCDRKRIVAEVRLGIEQHVTQANFGERIALLREAQQHVRFRALHFGGDDGIAALELQSLAGQARRHRLSADEVDLAELVSVPGSSRESDSEPARLLRYLLGGDHRSCVIIAFGSKDADGKRLVLPRPRGDLGTVRCFAVAILERRKRAEAAFEIDLLQAFDGESIANRGGPRLVFRGWRRSRDVEGRQRRQRLSQRGIGHRRVGNGFRVRILGCRGQLKAFDRLQRRVELGIERRKLRLEFAVRDDRAIGSGVGCVCASALVAKPARTARMIPVSFKSLRPRTARASFDRKGANWKALGPVWLQDLPTGAGTQQFRFAILSGSLPLLRLR
jgi:hypothetical protein